MKKYGMSCTTLSNTGNNKKHIKHQHPDNIQLTKSIQKQQHLDNTQLTNIVFRTHRIIIAAAEKTASKIGPLRSRSPDRSVSFVEPTTAVRLNDDLIRIREDVATAEREITTHLSASVLREASAVDRGLDDITCID